MRLTPADIHNTEFAKASLGRRGYNEEDVDSLLDEATQEMIRLLEENNALQGRLDAVPPSAGPDKSGRAAEAELLAATAELDRAQAGRERADHHARLARRQLDEAYQAATVDAGASPGRVLTMAQRTADQYLREAHDNARGLLAEAQSQAGRTAQEAHQVVDAIEQKTRRHQEEAAADLTARRAALRHDIDELTRFAAGYQAALHDHLQHQGGLMGGRADRAQ